MNNQQLERATSLKKEIKNLKDTLDLIIDDNENYHPSIWFRIPNGKNIGPSVYLKSTDDSTYNIEGLRTISKLAGDFVVKSLRDKLNEYEKEFETL